MRHGRLNRAGAGGRNGLAHSAVAEASEAPNHPLAIRMGVIAALSHNVLIGSIFGTAGVLLKPMQERMQVTPEMSSAGVPLVIVGSAILASVAGVLAARFSLRLLMAASAAASACAWLLLERPDIVAERDLPGIIRHHNVAVGGVNDDSQGYHETLTQLYIRGTRRFLADHGGGDLLGAVNALLASPMAPRDWPLSFYSRELLFSVAARRGWVEPDLAAI